MPRNIVSLRGGDAKGFWLAVDPADADADSKEPTHLGHFWKGSTLESFWEAGAELSLDPMKRFRAAL